ncbi:SRP19 [Symbiodinium sp. KB8]|nr:SRP19 [Symbiodinium sp. KB8]
MARAPGVPEGLDVSKWQIIYPNYINSKKTVQEGRRIGVDKACEHPRAFEMAEVCERGPYTGEALRTLPQIVLLTFQASGLPRLPDAMRWICGRFGAVIAVDGLSDADKRGAGIRALGLVDVPVCSYIVVPSEHRAYVADLDNTEHMWSTTWNGDFRPTGDLKAFLKKRRKASKKAKGVLRRAEEKVRAAGGEPSEQVSSYDSLLGETSSDGSSESNFSMAKEKAYPKDWLIRGRVRILLGPHMI